MKISVYLDSEKLRSRLAARLKELKKTPRGASIEAGLGASTIRNILDGRSVAPRVDTITALARVLDVNPLWFTEQTAVSPTETEFLKENTKFDLDPYFATSPLREMPPNMMPLFVPYVVKSVWAIQPPKAYTDRPSELRLVKNAYAMLVRNDLMNPIYKEGDIIMVNPQLSIKKDEDYLFYYSKAMTEGHDGILVIGRLVEETDNEYTYRQFGSTPELFSISKVEADRVHAIVGKKLREN